MVICVFTGGMTIDLGGGVVREHIDKRVAEAHRQPSPSSAAHAGSESSVAPRRRLYDCFMRSKEGKKKRGARARRASGYRMLAGPQGRRSNWRPCWEMPWSLVRAHSPPQRA